MLPPPVLLLFDRWLGKSPQPLCLLLSSHWLSGLNCDGGALGIMEEGGMALSPCGPEGDGPCIVLFWGLPPICGMCPPAWRRVRRRLWSLGSPQWLVPLSMAFCMLVWRSITPPASPQPVATIFFGGGPGSIWSSPPGCGVLLEALLAVSMASFCEGLDLSVLNPGVEGGP